MKIIDEQDLIPKYDILDKIICNHPFATNLSGSIDTITICLSERYGIPREMIEFDTSNTHITLHVGKTTHSKDNFEYILYHEFGHAADRFNQDFKYSEKVKLQLSDREKIGVMELWNIYIDSRLNMSGLFKLGYQPAAIGTVNGKIQKFPKGIDGKLLSHISILESCGFIHKKANEVVYRIWNYPNTSMTYKDLILAVKENIG